MSVGNRRMGEREGEGQVKGKCMGRQGKRVFVAMERRRQQLLHIDLSQQHGRDSVLG